MSGKATDSGGKGSKSEDSVLGSLPSTRPNRLGRRGRDDAAKPDASAAKATAAKSTRAKAPAKQTATAKTRTAASKTTKSAAAKATPSAPAKPGATSKASPVSAVPDAKPDSRPKAVRAGARNLKAPTPAERPNDPKSSQPSGPQLVGTVVQAAGELAQIGATVAGQIVKRAIDKFPKP